MINSAKTAMFSRMQQILGVETQIGKTIEELSEIIIELSRYNTSRFNRSNIIEELSHARFMLDQVEYIFNMTKAELDNAESKDTKRVTEMIEKEEQSNV